METAARITLVPVDDYLGSEAGGGTRHEYIGGSLYGMSGASESHNLLALNLATAFHRHLRGGPCKAYMSDFKVRLEINREDLFYYPDVMVACVRDGVEKYYLRYPKLVVEVLSPSTESIERREKLINYAQIPTLDEYVLVAQDVREVILHRRAEGWKPTAFTAPEALAEFRSIQFALPLSQIYDGVLSNP